MAFKRVSKKTAKIVLFIAVPALALSIVILALFPTLYNTVMRKELSLQEGTILTGVWSEIPLPIYEKLYFFNITNKESFLNGNEPLNVTEVGPYTYSSKWVKKDLQWNSNGTVAFREIRTFHFVPHMSNGTEEDLIYTLNGPMIIAAKIVKDYDVKLRALLSVLLGILGENVIIERSIKELAYGGYEDIIIKFAPILIPDLPYKDGIFSWLAGKNATDDGVYTVFTGEDDPMKVNIMDNWNGKPKLSFWKADTCNMLNGTNIEVGPSIKGDQDNYNFFQSIFCRTVSLNYTEDKTHLGIDSKRFRPTNQVFANSTENPDNYCFEIEKERPSGVLDVSPCQFGSPVFISFPHFYLADPSYLSIVNGLNPNDIDHGSHLDVEPITGVTIHGQVRFQINVELSEVEGIFQTYNLTEGIFPIFWAELDIEIDDDLAHFLKSTLGNPKIIAYSVLGFLVAASLIVAVTFLVILVLKESEDDDEPLLDAVDKEYDKSVNTTLANGNSYDNSSKDD